MFTVRSIYLPCLTCELYVACPILGRKLAISTTTKSPTFKKEKKVARHFDVGEGWAKCSSNHKRE